MFPESEYYTQKRQYMRDMRDVDRLYRDHECEENTALLPGVCTHCFRSFYKGNSHVSQIQIDKIERALESANKKKYWSIYRTLLAKGIPKDIIVNEILPKLFKKNFSKVYNN
jgi:hypothetical protein